ncbi:MAG: 5-guanidino-2-oxopentanoate decarboxylase, partial [Pseudomonadota bacterium]
QAYADSIPMLVVSSVNRTRNLGMGGDLHEIRNQSLIAAQAAAFSHTINHPDQLPAVLARAWSVFEGGRPRPVHIEVPLDLFSVDYHGPTVRRHPAPEPSAPDPATLADIARQLADAANPLMIAGGGGTGASLGELAEAYDTPVVMTVNGRGAVANGHPLAVPASPSLNALRDLISGSDWVLAVGTEFGRTDYDMYDLGGFEIPGKLIKVDIDAAQLAAGPQAEIALVSDAGRFCDEILRLPAMRDVSERSGPGRAHAAREAALAEIGPKYRRIVALMEMLQEVVPGAPIVCDSTQAAYAGNLYFHSDERQWFNASTGFGALGYGLPAAVGAALALADEGQPGAVICICGDGGLQFSIAELGAVVEEQLPLILLVWNNGGYGEIKDYMVDRQIKPVGVDLHTPDFVGIGRAYGAEAMALEDLADLPRLMIEAAERSGPTLIEIDEALVLGDL